MSVMVLGNSRSSGRMAVTPARDGRLVLALGGSPESRSGQLWGGLMAEYSRPWMQPALGRLHIARFPLPGSEMQPVLGWGPAEYNNIPLPRTKMQPALGCIAAECNNSSLPKTEMQLALEWATAEHNNISVYAEPRRSQH